jgi:hypothetical protein
MSIYIVHSHELNQHWEPTQEYKIRLDKIAEIIQRNHSEEIFVVLTWWKATKWIDLRHCDWWFNYLIKQWIWKDIILVEKDEFWSLESAWEAIFANIDHKELFQKEWIITLISSDYHENRLIKIHQFVTTNYLNCIINFIWINKEVHWNTTRTPEMEIKSMETFNETFKWINQWEINKILTRLWEKHPIYKNHPSNPFKQFK